jgi:hypothetical protein
MVYFFFIYHYFEEKTVFLSFIVLIINFSFENFSKFFIAQRHKQKIRNLNKLFLDVRANVAVSLLKQAITLITQTEMIMGNPKP